MKVLVTGGSGYLGTHVRKFFAADDLSRRSGRNILKASDAAMAGDYDVVIHMAADLDKSSERADAIFNINVAGTINILKAMNKDGVFIYMSTKDIYGRFADGFADVPESCPTVYAGQSPLEWSKLIAEKYVEYHANDRGFRSCIFRVSTPYAPASEGNMPNIVGAYADAINFGERIRFPGGGAPIRDYLHVDDLSRACSAFADSVIRHGTYNIGGGRKNSASLRDLVAKMEEVSGLQAVVDQENSLPPPVPMNYISDISLIEHELAWTPEITLETGLKTLFK